MWIIAGNLRSELAVLYYAGICKVPLRLYLTYDMGINSYCCFNIVELVVHLGLTRDAIQMTNVITKQIIVGMINYVCIVYMRLQM